MQRHVVHGGSGRGSVARRVRVQVDGASRSILLFWSVLATRNVCSKELLALEKELVIISAFVPAWNKRDPNENRPFCLAETYRW